MAVETPQTASLFSGWMLRIFLLLGAVVGLLSAANDIVHRLAVTRRGIAAEISAASLKTALPSAWSSGQGGPKAMFPVRLVHGAGAETITELYLERGVIEALLRGEKRRIVHEQDNPRRHRLEGDDPPPIAPGWPLFGLASFALFLWSLRLK